MFLYSIEKFMTSFLRHTMRFRALASMPLTHIIPCRVSNMYNTRIRVIQFILVLCFISWFRAVFTWLSKVIGFGFGFGFTTPFGWLVYLLWFWFYDSQVKTALSFIHFVKRSRTVHIHEEPELFTSDFITIPFLFLLHLGVAYITSFGSCGPIKDISLRVVSYQTNVSSCYREMERLEQERKMKELEELRRKVWTWSQNVHKPYKTDQKVYIAKPDNELRRLALSFVIKFVASKTSFARVSKGAALTFFHVNTHFLTVALYVISFNTSYSFIWHVTAPHCGS